MSDLSCISQVTAQKTKASRRVFEDVADVQADRSLSKGPCDTVQRNTGCVLTAWYCKIKSTQEISNFDSIRR